jgi:hypothetical protein
MAVEYSGAATGLPSSADFDDDSAPFLGIKAVEYWPNTTTN